MSSIGIIQSYEDKTLIMSIVCNDCNRYWNKIKMVLMIPLVFVNAFLVIINGYQEESSKWLQWVNMCLNSCNLLIMGLAQKLEVSEKCHMYAELAKKYGSLYNEIESKRALEQIDAVSLHEIGMKYENLLSSSDITVPNSIRRRIVNKYKNRRQLPNILMSSNDINSSPTNSTSLENV